jgi:hypothetical protein
LGGGGGAPVEEGFGSEGWGGGEEGEGGEEAEKRAHLSMIDGERGLGDVKFVPMHAGTQLNVSLRYSQRLKTRAVQELYFF